MACLLAVAVAAMALMVVQPGRQMAAFAARMSPPSATATAAEAFWRAAMPGAAMPDAIVELIHHYEHDGEAHATGDDPPPPMNFNYDDYRTDAAAPSPDVLKHADVSSSPPETATSTVFFLEDAVRGGDGGAAIAVVCHVDTARWDPDHAAFRLLGVRSGGGAAVCRAVAGGCVLAKN
uniref:BURP domain-containing protein n=1 Tax=Leersia perrieri TaxID=77586 RepID=A0A0D9XEX1_9ORYZ